jgi:hypothetical protein
MMISDEEKSPMTDTIEGWLADEILNAGKNSRESSGLAPNSYGAGFDRGRYEAFMEVAEKMRDLFGPSDAGQ